MAYLKGDYRKFPTIRPLPVHSLISDRMFFFISSVLSQIPSCPAEPLRNSADTHTNAQKSGSSHSLTHSQAELHTCFHGPLLLRHRLTNPGYSFWKVEVVCALRVFWISWSRRMKAERRPRAPCRTGRWRTALASRLYSPCGRCACRAGTGWGLRKQSPSYRWHTCGRKRTLMDYSQSIKTRHFL